MEFTTMSLSPEEKEIILKHRAKIEEKRSHVHLLRVTHDFANWLHVNQAGATYSIFCDDFGYAGRVGEDRPKLYDDVLTLIKTARSL